MGTSLLLGSKRLLCSLDGPQLLREAKRTLLNTYFPLRFHPLCFSKTTDVLRIRRTNADSWCATLSFFSFSLSWSSSSSHPGEDDEVPWSRSFFLGLEMRQASPPFSGKIALFFTKSRHTKMTLNKKKSQTMFFRFSPNYSTLRTIGVVSFYVGRRRFLPRFIPFVYWLAALLHLGWLCFISYAFNRFLFSLSRNGLFHSYLVHCVELPSRMSNKIVSFLK